MPLNQYVLPWDSQPQEVVGIGQNFDAAFCYLPPVSRAFDLVFSSALTEYNVAGVAVDSIGVTTAITSATGSIAGLSVRLDSTKVQTAIIQFRNTASNTDGILMAAKTHYSNAYGWMFESKTNENTLEFIGGNGILFPTMSAPGVGSADGRYKTVVVEWAGATVRAAMNGVYLGSVTVDAIGGSNAGVGVLNYSNNGASGGNSTNRRVALSAVLYGRYDILSLSANPWQLFAPRSIWVPSSSLKVPTRRRLIEQVTPWDSQPQEAVGVDWGNSVTAGLAYLTRAPQFPDEVKGRINSGTRTLSVSSGGVGATYSGAGGDSVTINTVVDGTSYALLARFNLTALTPLQQIFTQDSSSGGTNRINQLRVGKVSGVVDFIVFNTAGSDFTVSSAAIGLGPHAVLAVATASGTIELYVDGVRTSNTFTGTLRSPSAAAILPVIGNRNGVSEPFLGSINCVGLYTGVAPTQAAASSISTNPWQLFTPRKTYIPGYNPYVTIRRTRKMEMPWESQPQEAVEVNPDLQTGLLAAFNGAQISRLANGFPATLVGSIGSGVTPRGLGYQGDGTGKYAYYDNPSISTSALTILAVVYDGTTGTADRRALSVADRANANNYLAIGRGSTAAAKARVLVVVDGSAGTSTVETTRNVFDGQVHAIALRWTRGVGTQSFVDGSIDAFAANTTAANINATGTTVCALGRSTFATFYGGAVLLGASWARGLSDQECAKLTANPWSLFAPRQEWILSSSEVLMPTLSLPTLTGIGSTTARPRVSITY